MTDFERCLHFWYFLICLSPRPWLLLAAHPMLSAASSCCWVHVPFILAPSHTAPTISPSFCPHHDMHHGTLYGCFTLSPRRRVRIDACSIIQDDVKAADIRAPGAGGVGAGHGGLWKGPFLCPLLLFNAPTGTSLCSQDVWWDQASRQTSHHHIWFNFLWFDSVMEGA